MLAINEVDDKIMNDSAINYQREQRLMAMGEMAASLAHEIRNPLGSMELFCSLLKKDLNGQPDLLLLAEQIHTGIKTVNHIIANCLQFAKGVIVRRQPVASVRQYLDAALQQLQGRLHQSGVSVSVDVSGDGQLLIDHYQMKQVIINLVANALDAIEERFSAIKDTAEPKMISILSHVDVSGRWSLQIIDNGSGLSEDASQKIFEPFFTTKQEGTGLGLAVVQSIISAHRGCIEIKPNEGPGCAVHVSLPGNATTGDN